MSEVPRYQHRPLSLARAAKPDRFYVLGGLKTRLIFLAFCRGGRENNRLLEMLKVFSKSKTLEVSGVAGLWIRG